MADIPDSSTIMILFPDFGALKKEVDKLRTELSMLFLERDSLVYQECKNIEMAYMLAVGGLEYKVFELECKVRRQKRKSELIIAAKNRQEKANLTVIESILDKELAEYRTALETQLDKMNEALERSRGKPLSDDEEREYKKLYRSIVRALHPDLNPQITDAQLQLFHNAVEAYENGDLNTLRIIAEMIYEPKPMTEDDNAISALIKEKERLSVLVKNIGDEISKIKSEFPYTMKEFINNPSEIEQRRKELSNLADELAEALALYDRRIEEMLR